MEKYSAFRDPATGIQPFLPPVPPQGNESLAAIFKPATYMVGAVRTLIAATLAIVHLVVVEILLSLLSPIPILPVALAKLLTYVLVRAFLFVLGFFWIPVEVVKRKRRAASEERWNPGPGDLVVSNWISWAEIAWLTCKIDPCFALPLFITKDAPESIGMSVSSPTRKSARSSIPARNQNSLGKTEFIGFVETSLWQMIRATGGVPISPESPSALSFKAIRSRAQSKRKTLVVLPECTTSNARGLLKFANVFGDVPLPVTDFKVFVMCARVDPPTALSPSISHPLRQTLNPLPHILKLSSSLTSHILSIRLLAPSESPSSKVFKVSDFTSETTGGAITLSEVCATLIADIGRLKRTAMGWEEKTVLLSLMQQKK